MDSRIAKTEKAAAAGNKDAKVEYTVLKAYKEVLEQGKNARVVEFDTKDEQDAARNLFLLTTKPVLYVCNVDEASVLLMLPHLILNIRKDTILKTIAILFIIIWGYWFYCGTWNIAMCSKQKPSEIEIQQHDN